MNQKNNSDLMPAMRPDLPAWLHNIPDGYLCDHDGVVTVGADGEIGERLTRAPCWVSGTVIDDDGYCCRVTHWVDPDGYEHKEEIMECFFHGDRREIKCFLANGGLRMIFGKAEDCIEYLSKFCVSH